MQARSGSRLPAEQNGQLTLLGIRRRRRLRPSKSLGNSLVGHRAIGALTVDQLPLSLSTGPRRQRRVAFFTTSTRGAKVLRARGTSSTRVSTQRGRDQRRRF